MKRLCLIILCLASATPVSAATPTPSSFKAGVVAHAAPDLETGPDAKAYTYDVAGAGAFTINGKVTELSIVCAGIDYESKAAVKGTGRCLWRDAAGNKIFVSLETEGDHNRYTVTGGTGPWVGISGNYTTDFTFLPGSKDSLLLMETGQGSITK